MKDSKSKRCAKNKELARLYLDLQDSNQVSMKPDFQDYPEMAALRLTESRKLAQTLRNLCKTHGLTREPKDSFARWCFTQKMCGNGSDPLIPSYTAIPNIHDPGLEYELEIEKIDRDKINDINSRLEKAASESVARIAALGTEHKNTNVMTDSTIELVKNGDLIDIVLVGKAKVTISRTILERVVCQYLLCMPNTEGMFERIFCMIARYEALGGEGYQAAVPASTFSCLTKFGVTHECFASPLNNTLDSYGSVFPDTDRFFNSTGPFCNLRQKFSESGGSFQANPPFIEEVVLAMAWYFGGWLSEESVKPLSFCIFMPGWEDTPAFDVLMNSTFKVHHQIFEKNTHVYTKGFHYKLPPGTSSTVAYSKTFVFFLQNSEGSKQWPVTKEFISEFTKSFLC